MSEQDEPGPDSLGSKLDHLFATVPNPATGRAYSHEDVAAAVAAAGGPTISATYLWQLRRGLRTNPRMSHLEALAHHFQVDPAYFFSGPAATSALQDRRARALTQVAGALSEDSRRVLTAVAEQFAVLEGRAV